MIDKHGCYPDGFWRRKRVLELLQQMDDEERAACLQAIRCEFMGGVDWEKLRAEPRLEGMRIFSVGLVSALPDELVEPTVRVADPVHLNFGKPMGGFRCGQWSREARGTDNREWVTCKSCLALMG